jgi:hypothetical protein
MSEFLGSVVRHEGYNGSFVTVYLCAMPDGRILAVHLHGWFTF